ncbi:hypothetical protein PanWU01x14_112000, partial [Parasponia andersonii]
SSSSESPHVTWRSKELTSSVDVTCQCTKNL